MNRKGITLIELLVALSVSGILLAGIYRTFVTQQNTFSSQDQMVDMQQNVRLAINRMTRELRMAGFGGGNASNWDATQFFTHDPMYGSYTWVVEPGGGGTSVTIVEGFQLLIPTTLTAAAGSGSDRIYVNDVSSFDAPPNPRRYISINGIESHEILNINPATKEIQFHGWDKLINDHLPGAPIFLLGAITYSIGAFDGKPFCLLRDDHLGAGPQPVADNIESLRFEYFDGNGNQTAVLRDIRMIRVTAVGRSDQVDPKLAKVRSDGFRRQTVISNIQLRNLSF